MRLTKKRGRFGGSRSAAENCSFESRRQGLIIRQSVKTRVLSGGWATIALVTASVLLMSGTAAATMIPLGGGGVFNGGNLSVEVNGAGAGPGGPCINFFTTSPPHRHPKNTPLNSNHQI